MTLEYTHEQPVQIKLNEGSIINLVGGYNISFEIDDVEYFLKSSGVLDYNVSVSLENLTEILENVTKLNVFFKKLQNRALKFTDYKGFSKFVELNSDPLFKGFYHSNNSKFDYDDLASQLTNYRNDQFLSITGICHYDEKSLDKQSDDALLVKLPSEICSMICSYLTLDDVQHHETPIVDSSLAENFSQIELAGISAEEIQ